MNRYLVGCLACIGLHCPANSSGAELFPDVLTAGAPVVLKFVIDAPFQSAVTDMAEIPDGSDRLVVTLQNGEVRIVDKFGATSESLFLDTKTPQTGNVGFAHYGLTSVAFHPDYPHADRAGYGKFYTIDTERNFIAEPDFPSGATAVTHHNVVNEWTVNDFAAPDFTGSKREILRIEEPSAFHNTNDLAFDGDGLLYIAVGDSNRSSDARSLQSVLGKVLRIDPLGSNSLNGNYGIPDNPFTADPTAHHEIFAIGLRNPYRISVDEPTGNVYVGDVGEGSVEEVNRVHAGSDYGWPLKEGSLLYPSAAVDEPDEFGMTLAQREGLTDPLANLDHTEASSVIGGSVYRGTQVPWLVEDYLFADLANRDGPLVLDLDGDDALDPAGHQDVFGLRMDTERGEELLNPSPAGRTVTVGEDADGEIYYGTLNGYLLRLLGGTDLSGDGAVDGADAAHVFSNWNQRGVGDFNGDAVVDAADASILFQDWTGDTRGVPEPSGAAWMLIAALVFRMRLRP